jgi:hypothetical protein
MLCRTSLGIVVCLTTILVHRALAEDRLPVPEPAELEKADKALRQSHKVDFSKSRRAPDRITLGRKLLEETDGPTGQPSAKFAMFQAARDLGIESGSVELIGLAVDTMAEKFQIDALAMKEESLTKAADEVKLPSVARAMTEASLDLMDQAAGEERFSTAMSFARAAHAAAKKAMDKRLVDEVVARGKQVRGLEREQKEVAGLAEKIKTADDPQADYRVGRYECLIRKNWEHGLPLLAKGSEPAWQALATDDLAKPAEAAARRELGDRWWAMAGDQSEPFASALRARAGTWYRQAIDGLSGPEKTQVVKRLAELKGFRSASSKSASPKESPAHRATPKPDVKETAATQDNRIDLLAAIEPATVSGRSPWRLQDGELRVHPQDEPARLRIPVTPQGNYEVSLEFTRTDGYETLGVVLPVGSRQCLAALGYGGNASGLDMIDGRRANDNASTFGGVLTNGRRYKLDISVAVDGTEAAITAKLDDRPVFFYRGPVASLSLAKEWTLSPSRGLGLVSQSDVTIHKWSVVAGQ